MHNFISLVSHFEKFGSTVKPQIAPFWDPKLKAVFETFCDPKFKALFEKIQGYCYFYKWDCLSLKYPILPTFHHQNQYISLSKKDARH